MCLDFSTQQWNIVGLITSPLAIINISPPLSISVFPFCLSFCLHLSLCSVILCYFFLLILLCQFVFFCFHLSSFSSLPVCPLFCLSLCLNLREEVTKLKFEAKTFHIYANQKEVCVCIIETPPFPDGGAQEVKWLWPCFMHGDSTTMEPI